MTKFNVGDKAYIIENCIFVKEVIITKIAAGFYTVKTNKNTAYRVRESRLFSTEKEASSCIRNNR